MNNQQQQIKKNMDLKQKRIQSFQEKKDKSIAYFNSLNAAIQIVSSYNKKMEFTKAGLRSVFVLRDIILEEWENWYINNIVPSRPKLTRQDFAQAAKEAPERQAETEWVEDEKRETDDDTYQRSPNK